MNKKLQRTPASGVTLKPPGSPTSPDLGNNIVIDGDMHNHNYNVGNINGPVGLGPNAHVHTHDTNVQQSCNQNLSQLAQELAQLCNAMKRESDGSAEQEKAIREVTAAEKAAAQNDGATVTQHLKIAGKWTLGIAEKLGIAVATEAIKGSFTRGGGVIL